MTDQNSDAKHPVEANRNLSSRSMGLSQDKMGGLPKVAASDPNVTTSSSDLNPINDTGTGRLALVTFGDGPADITGDPNFTWNTAGGLTSIGTAIGVVGQSTSIGGEGVLGISTTSGVGVLGQTENISPGGSRVAGLYGVANTGTGVIGQSFSGVGIEGDAFASKVGVLGTTENTSPLLAIAGVQGVAAKGTGVMGQSSNGVGVLGQSEGGVGVEGQAAASGAIPIVAQGASGQTAHLQEWRNSSGSALSAVDKNGKLGVGTAAPTSALHVVGLPVHANNAAAKAGGLTAGAFYRTGKDPDTVCVVH